MDTELRLIVTMNEIMQIYGYKRPNWLIKKLGLELIMTLLDKDIDIDALFDNYKMYMGLYVIHYLPCKIDIYYKDISPDELSKLKNKIDEYLIKEESK